MDSLPQELVDHVSSYLSLEDLKNTLTVSLQFQLAAEKCSGAFSDFELSDRNASHFVKTFGGRRLSYLRHLSFRTTLPPLQEKADWATNHHHPVRETKDDLREADRCFTDQIKSLFSTVKSVEDCAGTRYGPGNIKLTIYTPTRYIDAMYYDVLRFYVSWRIRLLSPESLPELASVRALRIENGMHVEYCYQWDRQSLRKIDLRVIIDLSVKFPNLAALFCSIGGDEWLACNEDYRQRYVTKDWAGPRRDSRQEFARALSAHPISGLKDARLDFIAPFGPFRGGPYFNQLEAFPNLITPAKHDIFSSSLRVLSYQLRRLSIKAIVDPTLFWPADGASPSWDNLEVLNVSFHIMTPAGDWYFDRLTNDGSKEGYEITKTDYPPYTETDWEMTNLRLFDEVDWFNLLDGQNRVIPNDDTVVPLLIAFAKAAACMPRLKQALLWAPLVISYNGTTEDDEDAEDDEDEEDEEGDRNSLPESLNIHELTNHVHGGICEPLAWGLIYTSANAEGFMDDHGHRVEGVRQIWWQVAKWRPEKAVHQLITSIGQDIYGDNLIEYWEDDHNGSGLADGRRIERFEQKLFRTDYPSAEPRKMRLKY
jgi:hypothetical protein